MSDMYYCPIHRVELTSGSRPNNDCHPGSTELRGRCGCVYLVHNDIPRFVPKDNYAEAFGLQWNRYPKTQLDSYTGTNISLRRLERCLGHSVQELRGKRILEIGCGAGRFTELMVGYAGEYTAMDISGAVEANLNNIGRRPGYSVVQGDVNKSPLQFDYYDYVVCLGVIQHTPSPEQTIDSLARHVRPGGYLIIDHYTIKNWWTHITQYLSLHWVLRGIGKQLPPERGLRFSRFVTKICDPIRRRTSRYPLLDSLACRLFPSNCYYTTYPELGQKIIYEWNELDTHDTLTDWYKHRRSPAQLNAYLNGLHFEVIRSEFGGNGVEVKARRQG